MKVLKKILWIIRIKLGLYSATQSKEMQKSQEFTYMMLSRLRQDCEFFLNWGNGNRDRLYHGNIVDHIADMIKLHNNLVFKPEWLTLKEINKYSKNMKTKESEV